MYAFTFHPPPNSYPGHCFSIIKCISLHGVSFKNWAKTGLFSHEKVCPFPDSGLWKEGLVFVRIYLSPTSQLLSGSMLQHHQMHFNGFPLKIELKLVYSPMRKFTPFPDSGLWKEGLVFVGIYLSPTSPLLSGSLLQHHKKNFPQPIFQTVYIFGTKFSENYSH